MSNLPAFLRPLYWGSTSNVATIGATGVAVSDLSYSSVAALLYEFGVVGAVANAQFRVRFSSTSPLVVELYTADSSTFSVTWNDTDFRDILGFTGNLSGANSYTATHRARYTWVPTHINARQSFFALNHQERFSGRTAKSGVIAGVNVSGSDIYYRDFSFEFEPAANVSNNFSASDYTNAIDLDSFYTGATTALPDGAGENPITGFYYYPDYTDVETDTYTPTNVGVQGIDLETRVNKTVFCNFVIGSIEQHSASLPVTLERISVGFSVHTATAPTWVDPTA